MKLFFDIERRLLLSAVRGGGVNLLPLKAGGNEPLEVIFTRGKLAIAPDFPPSLRLALKDEPTGSLLALTDPADWSEDEGAWSVLLDTRATPLITWLGAKRASAAVVELAVWDATDDDLSTPPIWRSQPVDALVTNHVIRGDEGTPPPLPSPADWLEEHIAAAFLAAFSVPSFSTLAAANAALPIGKIFRNTTTATLEITTA